MSCVILILFLGILSIKMIRNSWFKDALKRKVLFIKISILLIFEKKTFRFFI